MDTVLRSTNRLHLDPEGRPGLGFNKARVKQWATWEHCLCLQIYGKRTVLQQMKASPWEKKNRCSKKHKHDSFYGNSIVGMKEMWKILGRQRVLLWEDCRFTSIPIFALNMIKLSIPQIPFLGIYYLFRKICTRMFFAGPKSKTWRMNEFTLCEHMWMQ